jgi:hypothetical protein
MVNNFLRDIKNASGFKDERDPVYHGDVPQSQGVQRPEGFLPKTIQAKWQRGIRHWGVGRGRFVRGVPW